MAEDNTPKKLVDDFETYIRNKYKKHFITEFDSMFGPVSNEEAGFNMFVKEDGTVFADRLYLKPESQKKGIGTEIMQELFEWSNKNNQPFQFILMAGYDNLSSPSKIVQTQKAFQEKLKDVPGLEAFPSEQGMLDTNITTYKYTPQLDTPTNVVDDFKLSGTMGGNTTPTGVNIAYVNVEDIEQFIQFDRKAEGNIEKINEIKKTILDKGYLYDTAYEGGVVFGVIVDELGNVQIAEGNNRLQALIDVAKETGQEIYVPINPVLRSTGGGNKVQLTNSDNAYNSMKQLLTDMLEDNKNFDLDMTISNKLGEPGRRIIELDSYTYPGGAPGTSTTQSNIKKFFNSIGLNTITYDELPDNSIYKTGVNTFIDTPTNVVDLNTEFETRPVLQNEEILQDGKYIKGSIKEGQVNRQDKILIESIEDFANYSKIPFTGDIEIIRVLGEGGIASTKELGFTDNNQLYIWHGIDDTYEYVDPKNEIALKKFLNENDLMNAFDNGELYLPVNRTVDQEILTRKEILKLPDTPGGSLGAAKLNDPLVFDSWVDNYGRTTTGFINDLPLDTGIRNLFINAAESRVKKLVTQVTTPGGILDTIDIWEIGVLALIAGAIAYNEIDEIPKITKNAILRTHNLSQGRPIDAPLRIIGVPILEVSEYNIDFEYAMETLEKGEKVMPTEIAIDYVQEKAEEFEGESTASGYAYMTPSAKNTDTMETTQKIQPGVQEEKMFEQLRPKKTKSSGGSGAKIL